MKKEVLDNIEKIVQKRELPKEEQTKISNRIISNAAIGIAAVMLVYIFIIAANYIQKESTIFMYNVYSIQTMIFSIIIFEIAYKKDSGTWALCGVETLVLSVFMLFAPYIFYKFSNTFLYAFIAIITVYYIVKIIRIYIVEKSNYLESKSDISSIIKRESLDEMAEIEKKKIKEQIKENKIKSKQKTKKEEKVITKEKGEKKENKTKTKKINSEKDAPEITTKTPVKRGRKPKIKEENKIEEIKKEEVKELEEKPKAKRGRKPKAKTEELKVEPKIKAEPKIEKVKAEPKIEQEKSSNAPKKRGRPRKNVTTTVEKETK